MKHLLDKLAFVSLIYLYFSAMGQDLNPAHWPGPMKWVCGISAALGVLTITMFSYEPFRTDGIKHKDR